MPSTDFEIKLSPFLQDFFETKALLNERVYNTHLACEFTLSDGVTKLYYATGGFIIDSLSLNGASVNIDPLTFVARLSGAPDIKHTQTLAPDIGKLPAIDLDYAISETIAGAERIFDNAAVRAYYAFPKPNGNYEGLIAFDGLVSDLSGDGDDADFSLISDLSNKASTVGREIPQRCVNDFTDDWCGVPASTVPSGGVCSKVWNDKKGGCIYWGGVFNGVPNELFKGYQGAVPSGGGWSPSDYPVGGCPDLYSVFKSANGGFIKGEDMRAGEAVIDYKGRVSVVESCERIWHDYRYLVTTRFGASIIVSASHKFISEVDDEIGVIAHEWHYEKYDLLVMTAKGLEIAERFKGIERAGNYAFRVAAAGECLKLGLRGSHIYGAAREIEYGQIQHHNQKSAYQNIPI